MFMINHLHLIFSSPDAAGFVRDFKKFTSKKLRKNIEQTEPTILKLFTQDDDFGFWKPDNMPIYLETEAVYHQKATYLEENPVRKNYVMQPEDW